MTHRKIVSRGLVFSLLFSVLAFASEPLRASPPIGAVVQSSDYDAVKRVTTVHIVNTSHKEISALDLSFQVTFPDGTVSAPGTSFFGLDFMEGIIQGKGGFAPGATLDQEFRQGPVQATVDVVAYSDGTADVLNEMVFRQIVAGRKARVRSWQKINELLNNALADPAEQHPGAKVLGQLKSLLAANGQHPDEGAGEYRSELQGAIQNISNLLGSPRLTEPAFEGNHLRALIKTHEGHISGMLPHTELVKGVRP